MATVDSRPTAVRPAPVSGVPNNLRFWFDPDIGLSNPAFPAVGPWTYGLYLGTDGAYTRQQPPRYISIGPIGEPWPEPPAQEAQGQPSPT